MILKYFFKVHKISFGLKINQSLVIDKVKKNNVNLNFKEAGKKRTAKYAYKEVPGTGDFTYKRNLLNPSSLQYFRYCHEE